MNKKMLKNDLDYRRNASCFAVFHLKILKKKKNAFKFVLGYPERIPYKYFRCHFRCLSSEQTMSSKYMDDRTATGHILENVGAYAHTYQLGLSQVLCMVYFHIKCMGNPSFYRVKVEAQTD